MIFLRRFSRVHVLLVGARARGCVSVCVRACVRACLRTHLRPTLPSSSSFAARRSSFTDHFLPSGMSRFQMEILVPAFELGTEATFQITIGPTGSLNSRCRMNRLICTTSVHLLSHVLRTLLCDRQTGGADLEGSETLIVE